MPNQAQNFFRLVGGLNTDASPIEFPAGFSADEQNYELLIDGSRRRRKGLELEAGGSVIDMTTTAPGASAAYTTGKWQNAGNIPQNDFVVIQTGQYLRFFLDEHPVSDNAKPFTVDLSTFGIDSASLADIIAAPVCFTSGRGHLFVTGPYTEPFYVEYIEASDEILTTPIKIIERDFEGIDDGYSDTVILSTEVPSHVYNLKNRGWTSEFLQDYVTALNSYPSKNMIPWLGLVRTLTSSNHYDADGVRQFAPNKLVSELFQDATAPLGHFLRDPFNTAEIESPESGAQYQIASWTINNTATTPQPKAVTVVTAEAHGLTAGDWITIQGQRRAYMDVFDKTFTWSFNGTYQVSVVVNTTTFVIPVLGPYDPPLVDWSYPPPETLGVVVTSTIPNPSGLTSPRRPKVNAFFAGRVFYAGTDYASLSTKLFFSQVIESNAQYGKCYQVADPTDERISDLVATDGGTIVIPEAADIQWLLPYGSSLLVFAYNGVWQIGPGEAGYFSANSYSVRKISDVGCCGGRTIVLAGGTPIYWGVNDIHAIVQDENTGFLVVRNLGEGKITRFYNEITMPHRLGAQGMYDDVTKTISWLYSKEGQGAPYDYRFALSLDTRFGAFIPHVFGVAGAGRVTALFPILVPTPSNVPKMRYVTCDNAGTGLSLMSMTDITFRDLGTNETEAYMLTAYDSAGDPAAQQSIPYVSVFSRKTETGYTQVGDQYTPIGASSTSMQARWDWSDNSVAGRWGTPQEIYRRARLYIPEDPTTDTFADGVPLVITKNMVRGRGRTLQLKFKAGEGKDSWIQGFKVYYNKARM